MEITKESFVELETHVQHSRSQGYQVIKDKHTKDSKVAIRNVILGNDGVFEVAYQIIYPNLNSRDAVNSSAFTIYDLELMLSWHGDQS